MAKQVGRQQILDQAIALLRAKGYAATSIDDIARACGITKGSLYYHFKGKEELAATAMDQVHAHFDEHIFSLILHAETADEHALLAFNQAIEHFFDTHPDGCLLANMSLERGPESQVFNEKINRFFSTWQACYTRVFLHQLNNTLRPADSAELMPSGKGPLTPPSADNETLARMQAEDALASVHGCILLYRLSGKMDALKRQHVRMAEQLGSTPQLRAMH